MSTKEWIEDCIRWRGKVLTGKYCHWCYEWDGLPVDETCREFGCCNCFYDEPEFIELRNKVAAEIAAMYKKEVDF